MILYVMPHLGQQPVQFSNLTGGQWNWFPWQTHTKEREPINSRKQAAKAFAPDPIPCVTLFRHPVKSAADETLSFVRTVVRECIAFCGGADRGAKEGDRGKA
jgi:hypothetical protein